MPFGWLTLLSFSVSGRTSRYGIGQTHNGAVNLFFKNNSVVFYPGRGGWAYSESNSKNPDDFADSPWDFFNEEKFICISTNKKSRGSQGFVDTTWLQRFEYVTNQVDQTILPGLRKRFFEHNTQTAAHVKKNNRVGVSLYKIVK